MSSKTFYERPQAAALAARLNEQRRFIQVVPGPRQVDKSTLVQQATQTLAVPVRYATADEPTLRGTDWIAQQWEAARLSIANGGGAVLALDEIQKIPVWSETVKRLWDEDTRAKRPLNVVFLGSAPLLIAQGLTESLAGRFETIILTPLVVCKSSAPNYKNCSDGLPRSGNCSTEDNKKICLICLKSASNQNDAYFSPMRQITRFPSI